MQTMDAPDIRWVTLSSSEHGGDHGDGDEHGEETAYDVEAFMHTIREGVTPGGARLSRDMPRWEMDDDDLKDLIGYLSTLP
jgi:hypothetical protein